MSPLPQVVPALRHHQRPPHDVPHLEQVVGEPEGGAPVAVRPDVAQIAHVPLRARPSSPALDRAPVPGAARVEVRAHAGAPAAQVAAFVHRQAVLLAGAQAVDRAVHQAGVFIDLLDGEAKGLLKLCYIGWKG